MLEVNKRFVNDLLKPWVDLNKLLLVSYAVQPGLSEITRAAGSIAVALRHVNEQLDDKTSNKELDALCPLISVMRDAGDFYKHGRLDKASRNCPIVVKSAFEIDTVGGFRFLRNIVYLQHATYGDMDFMQVSRDVIKFWVDYKKIDVVWDVVVGVNNGSFLPKAFLTFDQRYCANMNEFTLCFFKDVGGGVLEPSDTDFNFELKILPA